MSPPEMSALFNCRSSLWFLMPGFVPGSDPAQWHHFEEIFDELKRKSDRSGWNPVPRRKEFF
jgi:hypothetical protein